MSAGTPQQTGFSLSNSQLFGVGTAFTMLNGFLSSKMQTDTNVAAINAQTTAYQQMTQYSKAQAGQLELSGSYNEFERNALTRQGMQALTTQGRQSATTRSNYRAAQADSGVAMSGSKQDLLNQIDTDNFTSKRNLSENIANAYISHAMAYKQTLYNQQTSYNAGLQQYQNQINDYNNKIGNIGLATLQGSLGGMSTGISIAAGIKGLQSQ